MPQLLSWDELEDRVYETGVSQGVLYPYNVTTKKYEPGVAWNGLTAVNEKPSGAEENKVYADNIKYLSLYSAEEFGVSIECYTYPDAWMECDGTKSVVEGVNVGQQKRSSFGLSYRTIVGNAAEGEDYGEKLHLIWGCMAQPSERNYQTVNDSPEAITFSYEVTTTPQKVKPYKATPDGEDVKLKPLSVMTIDTTKLTDLGKANLAILETKLYGTAEEGSTPAIPAILPTPDEVIAIMTAPAATQQPVG